MKFDMVAPCASCPFRTDVKGFLHRGRVREIIDALTRQQKTFSCHKTVDYNGEELEDDGTRCDHIARADEQHCAGALIFLEISQRPNQMMRIAGRLGLYDHTKLHMDSPVFRSATAMAAHHGGVKR